jgi:23S rRNA pseudouridine2605 synthase
VNPISRSAVSPASHKQGGVRIQKLLSHAGVASRREAEALMAQGRVRVNGRVVTTLGTRVDPAADVVELDGRRVRAAAYRWVLLHKPGGTLTSRSDARGRKTVYHLLPVELRGLRYLGRLDRDTEGLLLFTNEGDLANRLLHPSAQIEREYQVGVVGAPNGETLRRLTRGVELDDGVARAATVKKLTAETEGAVLALVLLEGRKREVRRLLEAVGHPVRWLKRVRFGPQKLGKLPRGAWRELSEREVAALRASSRPTPERASR